MPRKNCTMRNTKNASVASSFGTMSGRNVLIHDSDENRMYCGTMITWIGSMIDMSMIANHRLRPPELQPGERVGRHRARDQVAEHRAEHDDRRVQQVVAERVQQGVPAVGVVAEVPLGGGSARARGR